MTVHVCGNFFSAEYIILFYGCSGKQSYNIIIVNGVSDDHYLFVLTTITNWLDYTVEPPNNGHIGGGTFVR